jgi:hypothetical protein
MNKFLSHLKQPSTFRGLAVLGALETDYGRFSYTLPELPALKDK